MCRTNRRDHPRVCGEKPPSGGSPARFSGSPPRVRGKVPKRSAPAGAAGITPACAGKRIWFLDNSILARDHPRVCGEKISVSAIMKIARGSPPRVRGKDCGHCRLSPLYGITPACAGKRLCYSLCLPPLWDHPRVCGEKPVAMHSCTTTRGSPPRMRGKGNPVSCTCSRPGITPAYAGKSLAPTYQPYVT